MCVCLVRRRSVTRRYSRVLRDRGNAGRLWKLHGASEREWCNVIHIHTHGEKRSALCVRYLILLVVNIVCVFEWYKTHPLAQWHRKSEKWMHLSALSVRTGADYHLFHAKVSVFVGCLWALTKGDLVSDWCGLLIINPNFIALEPSA